MPRSVQRSLTLETQPRAEISTSLARSLSALIDTYLNTFDPVLALWALAQRVGRQFTIGATCIFFWYPARFSRRHTIRLIAVIRDRRKKWNGAVGVCVCVRVFVSFQFVHDKYWITFCAIWEIGMLHRWENRLLRSFCFLAWMFFAHRQLVQMGTLIWQVAFLTCEPLSSLWDREEMKGKVFRMRSRSLFS